MRFLGFLFAPKNSNSPDVLGVYPEYMQVKALPERRYMKTSRFLAVLIIINIALTILIASFVIYITDRIDITIANRRVVNLYTIDSFQKVIQPAEYEEKSVSATSLYIEAMLRDYIKYRNEIVWDNIAMQQRWGNSGPVAAFSNRKTVYAPFQAEADLMYSESRSKGFVRDVHIYELKRVHGNTWEGIFDVFDMPIPNTFDPLCPCHDNSRTCLDCKTKNTLKQERFRVIARVSRGAVPSPVNPLGYQIQSYNVLYVPIHENEKYWGVPSDLKPEI